MGQLIKLENYISRYQQDIYHYPSQYIRLKQENWRNIFNLWEIKLEKSYLMIPDQEEHNGSFWEKWKGLFNKQADEDPSDIESPLPQTEEQLRRFFLNSIFEFQLNWASATLSKVSFLDPLYHDDLVLKYLLQRFPDTYLFMYKSIFKLKKAVVDVDLIMITPVGINVIKIVELGSDHSIIAGDDRSWLSEHKNVRSKFLSPMLSLKRSAKIVKSILDYEKVVLPLKKIILSRTNEITYDLEPYQTEYIDRNKHEEWLQRQRQLSIPLKHQQLKAAEALLNHSDTTSVDRPEWVQTEDE